MPSFRAMRTTESTASIEPNRLPVAVARSSGGNGRPLSVNERRKLDGFSCAGERIGDRVGVVGIGGRNRRIALDEHGGRRTRRLREHGARARAPVVQRHQQVAAAVHDGEQLGKQPVFGVGKIVGERQHRGLLEHGLGLAIAAAERQLDSLGRRGDGAAYAAEHGGVLAPRDRHEIAGSARRSCGERELCDSEHDDEHGA